LELGGLKMMKAFSIVPMVLLASCVSVGTNYSEAAAGQLRPGMTKAEVVRILGKPNSVVTLGDGRVQLGWVHSQGSMFGAKARSLTLPFSPDGHLLQVPGGAPSEGPPAIATSSSARVGTFSSTIDTTATTSISGAMPAPAVMPPGVQQLGPNIWLYPAPTPSGKCIQAPADYQGTGSATRPVISGSLPRC
jgi:SmpA / OmlA family